MMQRPRLCLDVREDAVYWVRAKGAGRSSTVIELGSVERRAGLDLEETLRELVNSALLRGEPIDIALSAAGLLHRREDLPALSRREAAEVVRRRAPDLLQAMEGEACFSFERRPGKQAGAVWLSAAPATAAREVFELWRECGVDIDRLGSRHLALARVASLLPALAEREIAAIFDLEPEQGTCVLADREGWLFGREFPLRGIGGSERRAIEIDLDDDDAERMEREESQSDASADRLLTTRAERLATELRRTFQYAEGELRLGSVSRVCVTGESPDVDELSVALTEKLGFPVDTLAAAIGRGPTKRIENGAVVALGLALWPGCTGGNLLPPEVLREKEQRTAHRRLLTGLGAVVAVSAVIASMMFMHFGSLRARAAEASIRLSQDQAQREQVTQGVRARMRASQLEEAMARIDTSNPSWVALIETISRVIPDSVALERMHFSRGEEGWVVSLSVEASGDSVSQAARAVSDFAQTLSASPLAVVDLVAQEEVVRVTAEQRLRAHVHFRLEARLAPIDLQSSRISEVRHGDDADV